MKSRPLIGLAATIILFGVVDARAEWCVSGWQVRYILIRAEPNENKLTGMRLGDIGREIEVFDVFGNGFGEWAEVGSRGPTGGRIFGYVRTQELPPPYDCGYSLR